MDVDIVFLEDVFDLNLPTVIRIMFAECYCLTRKCRDKVPTAIDKLTWMSVVFANITEDILRAETERQIERQKQLEGGLYGGCCFVGIGDSIGLPGIETEVQCECVDSNGTCQEDVSRPIVH